MNARSRKIALAAFALASLLASISASLAQVAPPVPALPDSERRTAYSLTASNCACSVGFALFGDGVDFNNWLEVFVNGVQAQATDPVFGWTITSPTGPLATIPRPITDAVLTFATPQTGTVQIVGARRPRRVSQFNENTGVPARNLNQALTDMVAMLREDWDKINDVTGRGLFSQPGNTMQGLPSPSACASAFLGFDATGLKPICLGAGPGSGNVLGPVTSVIGDISIFNNPTGSQIADSGISLSSQPANEFLATPSGATGPPIFRKIAYLDLPSQLANTGFGSIAGGAPGPLTPAQQTTLCNSFTTTLSGCVNPPGSVTGKFLGDDGSFHAAPGGGTMTGATGGQGCVSGTGGQTQITISGTVNCPTGSSNKLRNSSMSSWFHGSGTLTITTSGGWCLEGIYVVPTGASATCARSTNGLTNPLTFYSQLITGAASVTDVTVRFVIESLDAAPLAGQQVTFQVPVLNNTGASITPKITVKYPTAQDNYGSTTTDTNANAASMAAVANGATGTPNFAWLVPSAGINGMSIDIDFGNNFSSNAKSIQIGGGFDCHVTPGVSTGTVANPPAPEIRTTNEDIVWNKRFYQASYENGTAPGTATHNGMVYAGANDATTQGANSIAFASPMRPSTPVITSWDGAGTSGTLSTVVPTTGAFTDGAAAAHAPFGSSSAGFFASGPNATAHAPGFLHYTADATLTGG